MNQLSLFCCLFCFLSCDVSLVPQLVLPLEVWLLHFNRADESELWVEPDPENWGAVHGGEVHVHLLIVHQRNLLLLVPPAFTVTCDVMFAVDMFYLIIDKTGKCNLIQVIQ